MEGDSLKILWRVLAPGNLMVIGTVVVALLMLLRHQRAATLTVILIAGLEVLLVTVPVGSLLVQRLEQRFAMPDLPPTIDGIVVLGGSELPTITYDRGAPSFNDGSERLISFMELARRYPAARLIFSGGSTSFATPELADSVTARMLFQQLGFDIGRVEWEERSRNTFEGIRNSLGIARPKPGETWLLITSARHMPRAMGVAEHLGFSLIAYPVDYQTTRKLDAPGQFSAALGVLELAVREWGSLLLYRLAGRTDCLLPCGTHGN